MYSPYYLTTPHTLHGTPAAFAGDGPVAAPPPERLPALGTVALFQRLANTPVLPAPGLLYVHIAYMGNMVLA